MLGEATQQAGGSKDANDAAAKTAEIMTSSSHTAPATSHASSAAETADGGGDPAGYVNPFAAADDGAAGNGKDDDDMGLASGFAEAQSNTVHLNNIRSAVLEKVVEYLQWNAKYSDAPKDADIPPFEPRIPPDLALELYVWTVTCCAVRNSSDLGMFRALTSPTLILLPLQTHCCRLSRRIVGPPSHPLVDMYLYKQYRCSEARQTATVIQDVSLSGGHQRRLCWQGRA